MRTATRIVSAFLGLAALTSLGACARQDRCYIAEPEYQRMKAVFEKTASFQRTLDAMKDEQWPRCERNEFAYRLRKDLFLNPEDFEYVPVGEEPPPRHDIFGPLPLDEDDKDNPLKPKDPLRQKKDKDGGLY